MQTGTATLIAALAKRVVSWTKRKVKTDWALDGYGGDTSIDNLSDQVGSPITVTQSLDDGFPNELSTVNGSGAATASIPMAYGQSGMTASAYFSPFRSDSPVYGYNRDIAPITIDAGTVTTNGDEVIRVFTGQMVNTPVQSKARTARIDAISATRLKLSKLIQPPGVWGVGLNATWPILYALHKAGIYVQPPPRAGCRAWIPMSGSMRPMMDDRNTQNFGAYLRDGATNQIFPPNAYLEAGPFTVAQTATCTASKVSVISIFSIPMATGTNLLSQTASTGRIEFYIRGDACDLTYSPHDPLDWPGYPTSPNGLVVFRISNTDTILSSVALTHGYVTVGVDSARKPFVYVNDAAGHTGTFTHGSAVPTDGNWHCVGAAWSFSGKKLWVYLDGVQQTKIDGFVATLTTASLPVTDDFGHYSQPDPSLWSHVPISDVHVTSGATGNPDTTPAWLDTMTWTAGAIVVPSHIELTALVETQPREAWEFIGALAQGELAAIGVDEHDLFKYIPLRYWAQDAQQVSVDTLSTVTNVNELDVSLDYTRVRNIVSVNYSHVTPLNAAATWAVEVSGNASITLVPGITRVTLATTKPSIRIRELPFDPVDAAALVTRPSTAYFCANTIGDGSGIYMTSTSDIVATVVSWNPGSVTIDFNNTSGMTLYVSENMNWGSPLSIDGITVDVSSLSVIVRDTASIATRGERTITISAPAVQSELYAQQLGQSIVDQFGLPLARIEDATVFADPRRQPGDLVTFADAGNTGAAGTWREMVIMHTMDGPNYTQKVSLIKTYPTGIWVSDAEADPAVLAQACVWEGDTVWADDI